MIRNLCERLATRARLKAVGVAVCALAVVILFSATSYAQPSRPMSVPAPGKAATEQIPVLREIGIDQKLNGQLPLDLEFTDEHGATVKLGQYFGQRPIVLALVYYGCPMLCTQVLNGLAGSLQGMSYSVGKEYDVIVVSFDPGETPAMALDRKKQFVRRFIRTPLDGNIHFLTGRESSVKALTGYADVAVRASGGHHGAHLRRPHLALPLRRRVRAEGSEAGDR